MAHARSAVAVNVKRAVVHLGKNKKKENKGKQKFTGGSHENLQKTPKNEICKSLSATSMLTMGPLGQKSC
jgi:hypothetical protein